MEEHRVIALRSADSSTSREEDFSLYIHTAFEEEGPLFWEVIVLVILRKSLYEHLHIYEYLPKLCFLHLKTQQYF
jgi:hypothetical protein